jgi:hypothetical protein
LVEAVIGAETLGMGSFLVATVLIPEEDVSCFATQEEGEEEDEIV